MSNNSTIRNEVSKLAQQIETLARQVQDKLTTPGSDLLSVANELVRNSSNFVFVLGHMYAVEESGKNSKSSRTIKATTVSNPNNTVVSNKNYHNVRDSLGRFTRV